MKKYLLFGTGDYYDRYKKWFDGEVVLAVLDNAVEKQGTYLNGIRILSPEEGIQLNFDRIVILSFYVVEMRRQLIELGVSSDKIFHFYDLHKIFDVEEKEKEVRYYGGAKEIADCEEKNKILLLSQDMTFGGPSLALFQAARVLRRHGYQVVYASMLDGPLRDKLLKAGVPVIVDENMQIAVMKKVQWICKFSMYICNTINFYVFLSERNTRIPAIWWLHDSHFFYGGVDRSVLQRIDMTNLQVVSVGPVPKAAIHEFLPNMHIGQLLYSVEDTFLNKFHMRHGGKKIVFVTIGYIEARKGQDLLVNAIERLNQNVREKALFYLVGQDSSEMAKRLKKQSLEIPELIITGTVGRDEINQLLDCADVLICPSREDPMPTVCAEAMMHAVPCIVSDSVGTAAFISDTVNGFLFKSENVDELTSKIQWCVENHSELFVMGIRARAIYEKKYTTNIFEKELLELTEAALVHAERQRI